MTKTSPSAEAVQSASRWDDAIWMLMGFAHASQRFGGHTVVMPRTMSDGSQAGQ
jgi:hypothetical protein